MPRRLQQIHSTFEDAPEPGELRGEGPYRATIAEDATSKDHKVHIILDLSHPRHRYGAPARWQPRNDAQEMPKRGDHALVFIDERTDPWIAVWWPYG